MPGRPDAPALLAGTGKDQTHLLVVATGERGLAGGFNSSIARLAREHANKLLAEGKTVKILCVGKKGADILQRGLQEHIVEVISLREVKQLGYGTAQGISEKVLSMYAAGEFDVATLFYAEFKSVVSARSRTALQMIPAKFEPAEGGAPLKAGTAIYEYEPSEEAILEDLLPRNISVQVFRALLGKQRVVLWRADVGDGQCYPQRRRDDQQVAAVAITASVRRRSPKN